jgi:hypothetical protein
LSLVTGGLSLDATDPLFGICRFSSFSVKRDAI